MRPRVSIRLKFLGLTTALLAFCILVYLSVATTAIRKDKTSLVFDYNKQLVETLATEIESSLQSSSDKMELIAYLYGAQRGNDEDSLFIRQLVGDGSEIFWIGKSEDFKSIDRPLYSNENYLETYALKPKEVLESLKKAVPFKTLQKDGEVIFEMRIEGLPPILGFGKNVVFESDTGSSFKQFALVSLLKTDKWLKSIREHRQNELFVLSDRGQVLLSKAGSIGSDRRISKFIESRPRDSGTSTHVMEIEVGGQKYLSGSSSGYKQKIEVVSLVSEAKAFSVVEKLVRRTLHISVILAFLAFFAAYYFSKSLTRPIQTVVEGMKRVAVGHLDTQIQVSSRDEISLMADSFNKMIEDLKDSRSQLEEINKDLENKVKERTEQLEKQNQAVKSAQEALLRTTRLAAVGEIAGRAAHEVLNPLTSILSRLQKVSSSLEANSSHELEVIQDLAEAWEQDFQSGGFAKLVENWKRASEVREGQSLFDEDISNLKQARQNLLQERSQLLSDASFLMNESERIGRIVQSMRGLSIVSSDKKTHELSPLLMEAVNLMADYAERDGVVLSLKEIDRSFYVSLDKDEFLQSVTNLIRNSIQGIAEKQSRIQTLGEASQPFKGRIEVGIEADKEKEMVKVTVSDNGCGISKENQARLFDSQFSTKPRSEGTGLGLNISRRFIRAVDGDIELIHSELGKGTTFCIHLPTIELNARKESA